MSAPFYPSRERQNILEGLEAGDGQLIHRHLELIGGLICYCTGPCSVAAERWGFNLQEHKQILKLEEQLGHLLAEFRSNYHSGPLLTA